LFEAYFRYAAVSAAGKDLWRSFAPTSLGALVALELVQIPLAWSLARRLRDRQQEREELLQRTIDASENERRRIAGDLHDGVVQDLAGVAFSLAAASRQPGADADTRGLLDASAAGVRESIKSLRTLMVDIYPPRLAEAGLDNALADLVDATTARGLVAECDTTALSPVPEGETAALIYRSAQEAVRNVVAHAGATTVRVRAAVTDGFAVLDVLDDGVGFDPVRARARAREGHLGLRGLADRVEAAGGRFRIEPRAGGGTHLHVEVPW
jgi:signal transduction histidine kinase